MSERDGGTLELERQRIVVATAQPMTSNAAMISNENWFLACHEIGHAGYPVALLRLSRPGGARIDMRKGRGRFHVRSYYRGFMVAEVFRTMTTDRIR